MKRTAISSICFFALFSINLSAQKTNVWNGGFPGHENDWYFSKNWSLGETPDVFDNVVIPDVSTKTNRYPIVAFGQVEVQKIEIQSGASLTLYRAAGILTEIFVCNGTCKGCELRVKLDGRENPATAAVNNDCP